ncbi:MAG: restriction endonuclease subunit M, partial [Bacteroidetes bacterium]
NIDEKAFVWKKEFSMPFQKGGFDLIVGNPPYVDIKMIKNHFVKYYFKTYETATNRINLYAIFIEKVLSLLSNKGILSFIIPNSILVNSSYLKIREKLYQGIEKIIKLPDNIFESAKVETIIFKYFHNKQIDFAKALIFPHATKIEKIVETEKIKFKTFDKKNWNGKFLAFNIYADNEKQSIIRKCFENSESLENYVDFSLGITPYDKYKGHSDELIKNREFHTTNQKNKDYKPCISGQNITRFFISENISEYIKYGDWLGAKREERFFTEPRIIVRQILSGKPPRIYAGFTNKPLYFTQIGFSILTKNNDLNIKYILALFNSKLLNFIHKYKFTDVEKEIFSKILIENARILPIKKISLASQQIFIDKVNEILELQPKLYKIQT